MNRDEARKKAQELVSRMTLEEKASQLKYDAPAIKRLGVPAYNWWNEGLHGVARAGQATVFPQAIGMAATFDRNCVAEMADIVATEGRAKYNAYSSEEDRDIYKGLTFWSPNVNIFRDPRWGRGHETYGEDPYLTKELGVAFVKALQGDGETMKAAACAKHFAVHSGPEAIRHEFDAKASKHDMYDTYLYAFKRCVKDAKVEAVMGAYNRVNGEPACGSSALISPVSVAVGRVLRPIVSAAGHDVTEDAVHHALLDGKVNDGLFLSVVNACELGLLGFLLDHLHLIHDFGRDILGSQLRIIQEECLSVNCYLADSLSVCCNGTIRTDLHARKLFQQIFQHVIVSRLERSCIILDRVFLDDYRISGSGNARCIQNLLVRNGTPEGADGAFPPESCPQEQQQHNKGNGFQAACRGAGGAANEHEHGGCDLNVEC